jgi:DNA/RNA-binding domain of Phe-tRNA-synthetase-like protein
VTAGEHGWIDERVAEELPGLALVVRAVAAPTDAGAEPGVAERLRDLASRLRGPRAVELRREEVPAAYRVFFRHVGIDPDVQRTPIEAAVIERLVTGGYASRGRIDDALLLALVETSVPVLAFDADAVHGAIGVRPARRGERLGRSERARPVGSGRLVLADDSGPLAELFGEVAADVLPRTGARLLLLVAIAVATVPDVHVEEALWICEEALGDGAAE